MGWKRIEWRANDRESQLLEDLRKSLGLRSKSEVIRGALTLLARMRFPELLKSGSEPPTHSSEQDNSRKQ